MEQQEEHSSRRSKFSIWSFVFGVLTGFILTLVLLIVITIFANNYLKILFAKKEAEKLKNVSISISDSFDYTLSLIDSEQNPVNPDSLKNKPLFVLIWDPDCFHCISTLIHIQSLYEEIRNVDSQNIRLFTLTMKNKREKALRVLDDLKSTIPVYFAESDAIEQRFGNNYPLGLIINPQGEVIYRHMGSVNWHTNEVVQTLINLSVNETQ